MLLKFLPISIYCGLFLKCKHLLTTWPCLLFIIVFLTITSTLEAPTVTTKQMAFIFEWCSHKAACCMSLFKKLASVHAQSHFWSPLSLSTPSFLNFPEKLPVARLTCIESCLCYPSCIPICLQGMCHTFRQSLPSLPPLYSHCRLTMTRLVSSQRLNNKMK